MKNNWSEVDTPLVENMAVGSCVTVVQKMFRQRAAENRRCLQGGFWRGAAAEGCCPLVRSMVSLVEGVVQGPDLDGVGVGQAESDLTLPYPADAVFKVHGDGKPTAQKKLPLFVLVLVR